VFAAYLNNARSTALLLQWTAVFLMPSVGPDVYQQVAASLDKLLAVMIVPSHTTIFFHALTHHSLRH
jgi:hypothetical protein